MSAAAWRLTLAASVLMGLAMGRRSAFGLFVSPLNTASGMGLTAMSLALALGQLGVGLAQPVIGALADRHRSGRFGLSGTANIAGSIAIGLALKRYPAGNLLVGLYLIRALGIAGLLALPATPLVMLGFAVLMGASHMGTLPPTAQLVARHHGVERLGTLFGVVMLVHQAGSFAGIWLGGWAAEATGSDRLLWCIDIALALGAATLVWPRELILRRKTALPTPAREAAQRRSACAAGLSHRSAPARRC